MGKLIKDWGELINCTSKTHTIVIDKDRCCGWIYPKDGSKYTDCMKGRHYLSTHTFYGKTHEKSTKLLRKCGFDIEIDNWDKEVK